MKFMVECPVLSDADGGAWLSPDSIAEFARTAEESGLDAVAFTDHPAPSKKWLDGGGHETFDPFVALGFCAAVTSRIDLMTNLTVVPASPTNDPTPALTGDAESGSQIHVWVDNATCSGSALSSCRIRQLSP
jgi:hypothetical protein